MIIRCSGTSAASATGCTNSGAAFFRPTGEKLAALEFPAPETAYLYGFLCHFALDRACHGCIAEQIARSGVAHTEIEVEFDRSLLVQAGLDPIRTSLTGHLHASAQRGRDGGAAAG